MPRYLKHLKASSLTKLMRAIITELRQQNQISKQPFIPGDHTLHKIIASSRTEKYGHTKNISTWSTCQDIAILRTTAVVICRRSKIKSMAFLTSTKLEQPIDITLCLGIKTSHGQINKAAEVNNYLIITRQQ